MEKRFEPGDRVKTLVEKTLVVKTLEEKNTGEMVIPKDIKGTVKETKDNNSVVIVTIAISGITNDLPYRPNEIDPL